MDVAITYSGNRNTDLIPAGVTKATGIHQLMKLWRFPGHDYLCFGDTRTDIPMLKDVCLGITMEHADKEVMLHADAVCGRSDCNGISSFLRASSLIKKESYAAFLRKYKMFPYADELRIETFFI